MSQECCLCHKGHRREQENKLRFSMCFSLSHGEKRRSFVASILETLLKNSSFSHKGYLCGAAKVSALVGYLPSEYQLWDLCCSGHAGRLRSPSLLLDHRSLLLCITVVTFPTLCPPFSLVVLLSLHVS